MGYIECLEKAGAIIIAENSFGSYQGTWYAFVLYNNKKGIVMGSYGSCSGCDAFQSEFDWIYTPSKDGDKYYLNEYTDKECTKEEYKQALLLLDNKMKEFGESYLKVIQYTPEHFQYKLDNLDLEDSFDMEEKKELLWCINQKWND